MMIGIIIHCIHVLVQLRARRIIWNMYYAWKMGLQTFNAVPCGNGMQFLEEYPGPKPPPPPKKNKKIIKTNMDDSFNDAPIYCSPSNKNYCYVQYNKGISNFSILLTQYVYISPCSCLILAPLTLLLALVLASASAWSFPLSFEGCVRTWINFYWSLLYNYAYQYNIILLIQSTNSRVVK